jgi:hypothetical protein
MLIRRRDSTIASNRVPERQPSILSSATSPEISFTWEPSQKLREGLEGQKINHFQIEARYSPLVCLGDVNLQTARAQVSDSSTWKSQFLYENKSLNNLKFGRLSTLVLRAERKAAMAPTSTFSFAPSIYNISNAGKTVRGSDSESQSKNKVKSAIDQSGYSIVMS